MAIAYPVIGHWYRRTNGNLLKIVAVDDEDATIEVQFFDGTIDEVDFDTWNSMLLERVGAPEDWSGSVDMDPEDFVGEDSGEIPMGYHDPLSFLDKRD
ncbi:MAG: hypothetical protein IIA09_03600 [Proteobacteria bacterium]|nr:hypothetical protein [Pseudomonadota bacterium]